MRRSMLVAGSALALLLAVVVGPFGAAAAPPYVYGCTPATWYSNTTVYVVSLSIYNGSAATANVTHKVVAGDGTIMNGPLSVPLTTTLAAWHTTVRAWNTVIGAPGELSSAVPASVRIVSDVPVVATLSHERAVGDWRPLECLPIQP